MDYHGDQEIQDPGKRKSEKLLTSGTLTWSKDTSTVLVSEPLLRLLIILVSMASVQEFARLLNEALPSAAGHDKIDPTLTARNIVHALDGLSSYWKAIGNGINIPKNILMRIAKEYSDNDRRFLEVILHWLSGNQHCSWENIKHAVNELEKSKYVERIDTHIVDLKGILEHHRSGPHDRQLLPKSDTCYEEWWLKRVEFEPDPLSHNIYEKDLKDICGVINKYDPTKWKIIGQDLALLKSELDKIEIDKHDTETRLQEMIYTWINMDGRTWQELVDVLRNPNYNKAAADAMIEVARNRPKQHTGVPSVEKKIYKSLHDHQKKKNNVRVKKFQQRKNFADF